MRNQILAVALGGSLGAVARFLISGWFTHRTGRAILGGAGGTLVVNVAGCLLIGALAAWVEGRADLHPNLRLFLFTGCLGAFTTFSTFGLETFELLREGDPRTALANAVLSVVLGLCAVWAGWALVRGLTPH